MTFSIPELKGNSFDMNLLGDACRWEEARNSLFAICNQYEYWIDGIRSKAALFSEEWKCYAADNNVTACKRCLDRMRRGLAILQEDSQVREAFQLANKAMLLQYVHYSVVSKECDHLRQVNDGLRSWRPFQIAFLLMNIESMSDPFCDDRKLVDLIWFATGGGKTEAYLGLAAFTLILERLRREECTGSSVIMRYTLRLLSSQQFDRAAALICALEMIRRDDPERFGNKRFTIGFWVGQAASPNTWKEALAFYDAVKYSRSKHRIQDSGSTAIPVTKCPWCGEPMGEDGVGFVQMRNRDKGRNGDKYLAFVCPNGTCDFGSKENSLPLEVVDDEIYFNPPSLLLGTVDKFATIPFRKGSYAIFGIDEQGNRIHSPKLIIQDELHLISGPLGSMMAHYETLVDGLCSSESNSGVLKPKIIASTATICRAREQCHQLFACGKEKVEQFPPSGISHLDSYFARSDMESPGRRYVGVYAPVISAASAGIRLYTSLLWEPNTWRVDRVNEEDRYWSVVGYYGTTRELGQALTWTASEIPERLYEKRRLNPDKPHRYLNNVVELTGRKDAAEVRKGLARLELSRSEKGCVDLCLATNMISVGLDVPRLGTMVICSQPKQTSEYIQASSRIGRGSDSKGMVFVLYGSTRPRDRSHYENFKNYHESFYRYVEPSSVTAFCKQVRKRALAGVLVGLYRAINPSIETPNDPDKSKLKTICDRIIDRIRRVDPDEVVGAQADLADIVERWMCQDYARWESLNPLPCAVDSEKAVPLLHPTGVTPCAEWAMSSFEAPLSLRTVDDECRVAVIGRYPSDEEGSE